MKKYIHLPVLLLLIVWFISCDKVTNPQPKALIVDTTSSNATVRKILVEDYTGHHCGNCPKAHQYVDSLLKYHGIKIIPIGVHVGNSPGSNAYPFGVMYKSDFRTPAGNDYASIFGIGAELPTLLINRIAYNSGDLSAMQFNVIELGQDYSSIDTLLNKPQLADIKITNTYNASSKSLSCDIKTKFLIDTSGTYNLVVLITQDSIIDYQLDDTKNPADLPGYVHRHVLRDGVTTSWGDLLSSGSIDSAATFNKSYTYTFPTNDLYINTPSIPLNCSVVAYIYKSGTYEVVQAEEQKVK